MDQRGKEMTKAYAEILVTLLNTVKKFNSYYVYAACWPKVICK